MYAYAYDSYDLTAMLGQNGDRLPDGETGQPGYQVSYSTDWTGIQMEKLIGKIVRAGNDAPNQIEYPDPPPDKTMLTACTYHAVIGHTGTCPVIFTSGTVKPVDSAKFYNYGWDVANH